MSQPDLVEESGGNANVDMNGKRSSIVEQAVKTVTNARFVLDFMPLKKIAYTPSSQKLRLNGTLPETANSHPKISFGDQPRKSGGSVARGMNGKQLFVQEQKIKRTAVQCATASLC